MEQRWSRQFYYKIYLGHVFDWLSENFHFLNKHLIVKKIFLCNTLLEGFLSLMRVHWFLHCFSVFKGFHRVQDLKDFCNCKLLVKLLYIFHIYGAVGFTPLCCCITFPDEDVELLIKFLRGLFDDFSVLNLRLCCFCVSAFILC